MKLVKGLSAFPITPQSADGIVDLGKLELLVRRLVDARVDSIGLLGSTGTYAFLSREQRRLAVETASRVIRERGGEGARPLLLVGIGHLRTDECVAVARDAALSGADAGLLSPVTYNGLTQEEMYGHFLAVTDAVPDLPLVIYNNASASHFTFGPELIERLAALPSVVGIKYPARRKPSEARELHESLVRAVGPRAHSDFCVGYSYDGRAVEGLLAGGDAWFSVLAGLGGRFSAALRAIVDAESPAAARALNEPLWPLWDLMAEYGSLRVAYFVANELNVCRAHLPLPLLPLEAKAASLVRKALEAADLWHAE